MKPVLHTIGHSNHSLEEFRRLLRGVGVVCDVRSHPASRRLPHFSREALRQSLPEFGVGYEWLGRELGGRAIADPAEFQAGIDRIVRLAAAGRAPALMCAEKDPVTCHRALLVCRALRGEGLDIRHILADGRVETHDQMEERLMDMFQRPVLLSAANDLDRAYDWLAKKVIRRPAVA